MFLWISGNANTEIRWRCILKLVIEGSRNISPEATQKWIVDNMTRWGKVVRDNNIRAE